MIVPGQMNFYGSTFIGRPILTSGWNEHLGWSHTVNAPDLEEIYEVDLDPRMSGPLPVRRRLGAARRDEVTVQIRDGADLVPTKRTFWHTPLGPVVHRTPTKAYVAAQCQL